MASKLKNADWKAIEDDREKYAAYLCSREWNVLKEAVHKRAAGICERCRVFPINAVHHLTYERKYREELVDLQGTCKHCHEFTHGKSDVDPGSWRYGIKRFAKFLIYTKSNGKNPPPIDFVCIGLRLKPHLQDALRGARILVEADLERVAHAVTNLFPFSMPNPRMLDKVEPSDQMEVEFMYRSLGFDLTVSSEYLAGPEDEDE